MELTCIGLTDLWTVASLDTCQVFYSVWESGYDLCSDSYVIFQTEISARVCFAAAIHNFTLIKICRSLLKDYVHK